MTGRGNYVYFHALRVRWNECDAQGIVFNVNYFLYYDIAMWEYLRALGYATPQIAPEFVTVRAEADFKGAAAFDDHLDVAMRTARTGNTSLVIEGAIFRGDELLNLGRLTYVHVQKGTRSPIALSSDYLERVQAFEPLAQGSG